MTRDPMVQTAINTIRTLSIDAVQQAESGHPGTPMALAPLVYPHWNRVMRFVGAGFDARLGAIRRHGGLCDRNGNVRCIRSAQSAAAAFRFRAE
jgi:Transketolase, thiamine diphosphate binding domain